MQNGISTVGVILSYGVENTAGVKPTDFKQLHRINSVAGVELSTEQIDASALEDSVSKYIAGRQDTGGSWDITVNLTDETIDEWEDVISEATAGEAAGKATWFQVAAPSMAKAFFIKAQPPKKIAMPTMDQNGLLTGTMSCTVNDYVGLDTKVAPTV